MSNNTVTCSFTMDRETYDAFKSIVIKNHQNVKGSLISYMKYVIEYGTPNAETIDAINEVKNMKENPNIGRTYDNVDDMMTELLDV